MQARREHWAPAEAWRHKVRAAFVPWFGPVFWPYAYSDVFDYTFWPYAYDESYWAFVYDDFFDGIFFPYGAPYVADAYTGPYGSDRYAEQYDPGANVYYGSGKAAPTIGSVSRRLDTSAQNPIQALLLGPFKRSRTRYSRAMNSARFWMI